MSQLLQLHDLYNGNESEFLSQTVTTCLDLPMERAMNHTIFLKYVNLARLEATKRAYKKIQERAKDKD